MHMQPRPRQTQISMADYTHRAGLDLFRQGRTGLQCDAMSAAYNAICSLVEFLPSVPGSTSTRLACPTSSTWHSEQLEFDYNRDGSRGRTSSPSLFDYRMQITDTGARNVTRARRFYACSSNCSARTASATSSTMVPSSSSNAVLSHSDLLCQTASKQAARSCSSWSTLKADVFASR